MSTFLVLLLACVTEASFPRQVANVACARSEECFRSDFESTYSDHGDCVEDVSDTFQHTFDCFAEHCEFDPAGANDYLGELRTAECDEVSASLGDAEGVYDNCEDEFGLLACVLGG